MGDHESAARPRLRERSASLEWDFAVVSVVYDKQWGTEIPGKNGCIEFLEADVESGLDAVLHRGHGVRPEAHSLGKRMNKIAHVDGWSEEHKSLARQRSVSQYALEFVFWLARPTIH